MKRKIQILLVLFIFSINFLLDRVTKLLATTYLQGEATISYFYNTIVLKYVENSGAFLSLGANWPDYIKIIALLVLPMLVCFYGLYYCAFKWNDKKMIIVSTCILSGGIGNLTDRLLYDFRVVDFINFGIGNVRTGILNVADMSVTVGVLYLIIDQIVVQQKNK